MESFKTTTLALLTFSCLGQAAAFAASTESPVGAAADIGAPIERAEGARDERAISGNITRISLVKGIGRLTEQLIDSHCERSQQYRELTEKVEHYKKKHQKVLAVGKDSLDYTLHTKGPIASRNMGKLVLDENYRIGDLYIAEYSRQKYVDALHQKVVGAMMQICEAHGNDSAESDLLRREGEAVLSALVGAEQAGEAAGELRKWLAAVKVEDGDLARAPWTTLERSQRLSLLVNAAVKGDPVINKIKQQVADYAHPSAGKLRMHKVMDTTLSLASLSLPGLMAPLAAEGLLNGYVMATGGSEQAKLERELLLYKRIQSRLDVLSNEASLALDNYRFALVSRNRPLLAFTSAFMAAMTSASVTDDVTKEHGVTDSPANLPQLSDYMRSDEDEEDDDDDDDDD